MPDLVDQYLRGREMLLLILECSCCNPVVHCRNARSERVTGMLAAQGLEAEALGKSDASHASPRMIAPSRF